MDPGSISQARPVTGERVVLRTRPGIPFAALYRPALLAPALLALAGALALAVLPDGWLPEGVAGWLVGGAFLWVLIYLLWGVLEWWSRCYALTDTRVTVNAGVLSRVAADVPLRNVQHVTASQSLLERLFGLGTIGVATAGADGAAIHWLMVPGSGALLAQISDAVDRAQARAAPLSSPQPLGPSPGHPSRGPTVIGLAGGIGSGKTEVARILAELGCVVSDSDAEAKAALDRPEVRARLVEWWGNGVIGSDGRVARSAVARIVFAQPGERQRLESLVHPLVKASRQEAYQRAKAAGARAFVIDAPLLFEAGVDAECDAVIFVDARRDFRLERVRATRGWDEAELARRESAQMPADEKRRRSHDVVTNDGSRERLREAVSAALERILQRPRAGPSSAPGTRQ